MLSRQSSVLLPSAQCRCGTKVPRHPPTATPTSHYYHHHHHLSTTHQPTNPSTAPTNPTTHPLHEQHLSSVTTPAHLVSIHPAWALLDMLDLAAVHEGDVVLHAQHQRAQAAVCAGLPAAAAAARRVRPPGSVWRMPPARPCLPACPRQAGQSPRAATPLQRRQGLARPLCFARSLAYLLLSTVVRSHIRSCTRQGQVGSFLGSKTGPQSRPPALRATQHCRAPTHPEARAARRLVPTGGRGAQEGAPLGLSCRRSGAAPHPGCLPRPCSVAASRGAGRSSLLQARGAPVWVPAPAESGWPPAVGAAGPPEAVTACAGSRGCGGTPSLA